MEFSNLSEYVQEYELRNRIGGCFSGNSSRMDNRNRRTYCDYCVQQNANMLPATFTADVSAAALPVC